MLYAAFLAPLFISFLFVHELTGSLVVSTFGVSELIWETFRVAFVISFAALRLLTFREEL